jgi:hypothetical protein
MLLQEVRKIITNSWFREIILTASSKVVEFIPHYPICMNTWWLMNLASSCLWKSVIFSQFKRLVMNEKHLCIKWVRLHESIHNSFIVAFRNICRSKSFIIWGAKICLWCYNHIYPGVRELNILHLYGPSNHPLPVNVV